MIGTEVDFHEKADTETARTGRTGFASFLEPHEPVCRSPAQIWRQREKTPGYGYFGRHVEAFDKIYPSLDQGDRILVGTITGRSYIDFKPSVDVEIPRKSLWMNRIRFERKLTETKDTIRKEVEILFSRKKGTPRTEILNSLNIADTIFHEEKRDKVLVILSDMIQDSQEYNFAQVDVTKDYIDRVIRYRHEHKFIPNLKDVKIYVAGASGKDPAKFRSVERFWTRYFEKSGADFSPHRYGHSLISFEKES